MGQPSTIGTLTYELGDTLASTRTEIGSRDTAELKVDDSHVGQYATVVMQGADRVNPKTSLTLTARAYDPQTGLWHDSGGLGWEGNTGGPDTPYPGLGITLVDVGKTLVFRLASPDPGLKATVYVADIVELEVPEAVQRSSSAAPPNQRPVIGGTPIGTIYL